jgi:hypothetical protein
MNSIYHDSLIAELKDLTTRKDVCVSKLLSTCNKVKNKVFGMVSQNEDMPDSLRYVMHLRSQLICMKEVRSKKK